MGWSEIIALCVGIVATIAGGIGLKLAENKISALGVIRVYAKIINEQMASDGKTMAITMKFDIINAKKSPYILRDLNLVRFDGRALTYFVQGENTKSKNSKGELTNETNYCNDGSYTFVVASQDTKQVVCMFMDDTDKFDLKNKKYAMRFYDERGKVQLYNINEKNTLKDNTWIELTKINQKKQTTAKR